MDCKTCKEIRQQGDKYYTDIIAAMADRTIKRLWVVIIILLIGFFTMTYLYIAEKTSYETTEATVEVDTGEGNAYVAGIGDVYYGESQGESQNQEA